MRRLALDIDPIAFVRNNLGQSEPDPVSAVVMAELGGAESIVCYLRDDQLTVKPRDVKLFKEVVKTHLTVRSNLSDETVRNLISMKVDMITFVSPGEKNTINPQTLSLDTYASQLQNYIAELRSNNILSSVFIDPNITEVKNAGRLEFDYIEFDASSLSNATDMDSELDALDTLNSLSMAANKLAMGVNISGGLNYDNIRELSQIDFLEDIVIGKPVLSKAVFIGIEQALRDLQILIS